MEVLSLPSFIYTGGCVSCWARKQEAKTKFSSSVNVFVPKYKLNKTKQLRCLNFFPSDSVLTSSFSGK